MPPLPLEQTKKLVVYIGVVVGLLGVILALNVKVHDRTTTTRADGAGVPLRAGLERLNANPTKCAMTMEPSPDNERPMRHVNATIRGKVDVLVLGQSDADHMSKTFFKDDVRFYNGFLSNSYFVYQYEVFEDLVRAHGAPKLVLIDVRSGRLLVPGLEPSWDSPPPGDPVWWGFPPFHLGTAQAVPWYKDLPSLLSLAQTERTVKWLGDELARKPPANSGDTETDIGAQFRCVSQDTKSLMYRWLADGSRIYVGELHGVFGPPKQFRLEEAIGDRHLNESRYAGLAFLLGRVHDAGSTIIVYSPPLHPRSFEDPKQVAIMRAADAHIREIAEGFGLDYCDLSEDAGKLGCTLNDFADEHHISRHCDERVVHALATGCAPRAGAALSAVLRPEILK